jgi:acyl carrier protein
MIDRQLILQAMREFVAEELPDRMPENFESATANEVIRQSLELVEFILFLEEKLGVEVNINQIGDSLITKNFGELAEELAKLGAETT